MPTLRTAPALLLAALGGCKSCSDDPAAGPEPCEAPEPPAAATLQAGAQGDVFLLPGGRAIAPAGPTTVVGGFPVDVLVHPDIPVVYVQNGGHGVTALQVLDLTNGEVLQQIDRSGAFMGLALSPSGDVLYASGGSSDRIDVYTVASDGTLDDDGAVELGEHTAGLALTSDGSTLWVALIKAKELAAVDVASGEITATIGLSGAPFAVALAPDEQTLWISAFGNNYVMAVDLTSGTVGSEVEVGSNPMGIVLSDDGGTLYVAASDSDSVVMVDTASASVLASTVIGESSIASDDGTPLPATSPSALALDNEAGLLYVTRAADNAVGVLDAESLAPMGLIPVGWYPTSVALSADAGTLVVANGKGIGAGPDTGQSSNDLMKGSVTVVDLAAGDPDTWTAEAEDAIRRPDDVYPFECEGTFPVPPPGSVGGPIEHVVLIVRENKTYDALLGDLEGADGDPDAAIFGEEITPNVHALARRFAHHDNFYDDSEVSIQGHLWLTSSFVNDYSERTWLADDYDGLSWGIGTVTDAGQPDFGTFFTHLIRHGVDFTNYGEVVGILGEVDGETVIEHTDLEYPGVFFDLEVADKDRAEYLAYKLIDKGEFPPFVFAMFPRDHTYGTEPGKPTPETMISDNDWATGYFIDRLSHSDAWANTVVFILEDDPQTGDDHVDGHRSILVVASPYAKRGYVSHVHASYPSVFRTIELILGVPPMNRYDALATPLWDAFTSVPDDEPFTMLPTTVEEGSNAKTARGAECSEKMDFAGPDRAPHLGEVLVWHRTGVRPAGLECDEEEDEDDPEEDAWAASERAAWKWMEEHPEKPRWQAGR